MAVDVYFPYFFALQGFLERHKPSLNVTLMLRLFSKVLARSLLLTNKKTTLVKAFYMLCSSQSSMTEKPPSVQPTKGPCHDVGYAQESQQSCPYSVSMKVML